MALAWARAIGLLPECCQAAPILGERSQIQPDLGLDMANLAENLGPNGF
jgi:hypothetical protein